jgi:hypothetical protein
MKTELVLFGRHIDMAAQVRRRRLVVIVYGIFAALMASGWFLDHWGLLGSILIIFSAPSISRLVFGGYGAAGKGLIKPFLGNEVRARYIGDPNSRWSRLARLTIPQVTDKREFCSDEREVRRRDGAHEVAYRRLGMVVISTFLVAYLKNVGLPLLSKQGIPIPDSFVDKLIYGMLITSFILFLSLPQAILLWTEPDMEGEGMK